MSEGSKMEADTIQPEPSIQQSGSSGDRVAVHNDTYDVSEAALGDPLAKYYLDYRFLGTALSMFLGINGSNAGYVMSANVLSTIVADVGQSNQLIWVSLSFTLALSVSFLLIGRLSDIFGRRWFFIGGAIVGLVASIVGSTAHGVGALIGANSLSGMYSAVQICFPIAICELVPMKHRPAWTGGIYGSEIIFVGFGPAIAHALVDTTAAGWRWCYYLPAIISAAQIILLFACYHPPDFHLLHTRRTYWDQLKRQDYTGIALFTGGFIVFLMGISWGGNVYPWKSAHVIATITTGSLTMIVFGFHKARFKGDVLVPKHLFKTRGFISMLGAASVGSCVYYSMVVIWPQLVGSLFGGSPQHQGLVASVLGCGAASGQGLGGLILHFLRRDKMTFVISCILLTAFCGSMAAIQPGDQSMGIALMFLAGACVGIIETGSTALLPLSCPNEDLGVANGVLGSTRSGAAAIATAIYTAILTNKRKSIVPARVSKAAINAGLPGTSLPLLLELLPTGNLTAVPGITESIIAMVEDSQARALADCFRHVSTAFSLHSSLTRSFRYVWYAVIAFGAAAITCSLFVADYAQFRTGEVARKMKGKVPTVSQGADAEKAADHDKIDHSSHKQGSEGEEII